MLLSDNRATLSSSNLSFYERIKVIGCPGTYKKKHAHEIKWVSNCFLDALEDVNVRNPITTPVCKVRFKPVPSTCIKFETSTCMRPEGSYETRQNVKEVRFTEFVEVQFLDDFKKHVRFTENVMVRIIPARD